MQDVEIKLVEIKLTMMRVAGAWVVFGCVAAACVAMVVERRKRRRRRRRSWEERNVVTRVTPDAALAAARREDFTAGAGAGAGVTSSLALKMPAEWEPHRRCWMAFPTRLDTWPQGAAPAQAQFMHVAVAIAEFEPVTVCAPPQAVEAALALLAGTTAANVTVVGMEQDGAWFRDTGATFAVATACSCQKCQDVKGRRHVVALSWHFNAWGEVCYGSWERDQLVASNMASMGGVDTCLEVPMVLEGGSIHVDGCGTLLTTEECLLHGGRNPGMDKAAYERMFRRFLGVTRVIWLPFGVHGDTDTAGHVDNMACFLCPGVVALHWCDDVRHPQHARSAAALRVLQRTTDATGRRLRVVKLLAPRNLLRTPSEMPAQVDVSQIDAPCVGDPLPGSYINFYMPNGGAVVPQFGDLERDAAALAVLQRELPSRRVVGVASRAILVGGGNIHCITQQQPM